jgi:hypothetical protein
MIGVVNGSLRVTGTVASEIQLADTAAISGSGSIGDIRGSGAVSMGATVLNATSSSALVHQFLFSTAEPADPADATTSGNSVLRLSGPQAFGAGLGGGHRIDLHLAAIPAAGQRAEGGFFLSSAAALQTALNAAEVRILLADLEGEISHLDADYRVAEEDDGLVWEVVLTEPDFGAGPEAGAWIGIRQIQTTATGFEAWREEAFSVGELDDQDISGPLADPSGQGVSNLMRYALGLGRNDPPQPALPEFIGSEFRFPIDLEKSDIVYRVAQSEDLIDWTSVIYHSREDTEPEPEDGQLSLPVDTEGAKRFFRLEVVQD